MVVETSIVSKFSKILPYNHVSHAGARLGVEDALDGGAATGTASFAASSSPGSEYLRLNAAPAPANTVVSVANGGVTFNLTFTAADNPTANFETDVENAAKLLSAAIKGNYTVNLTIGYGEINGDPLTGGSAEAGPANGVYKSYAAVRAALIAAAPAGDTNFSALPTGSTIGGKSTVAVWSTQEKALGFLSGTATENDGDVGFATDISDASMVGVALHEITHAMGRSPFTDGSGDPDIFEFTRFSAPGVYVNDESLPAPASYFSVDGGITKLADYGQNSDPSDFANPGYGAPLSSLTPNDPFNQYYSNGTYQYLTKVDLTQLDAMGIYTYVRKSVAHDLNGDGLSDILWRSHTGSDSLWDMNAGGGHTAVNPGTVATSAQVAGVGDFNGDGISDILWRNGATGADSLWDMNAGGGHAAVNPGTVTTSFEVAGVGDFNGDGLADILWRNGATGADYIWDMNAAGGHISVNPGTVATSLEVAGVGDFNHDGLADILWRNPTTGADYIWDMTAAGGHTSVNPGTVATSVQVAGIGDFNGDGVADILWRNPTTGADYLWDMNAVGGHTAVNPGTVATSWQIASIGDFNGDGVSDILWRNTASGANSIWDMNAGGGHIAVNPGTVGTNWTAAT